MKLKAITSYLEGVAPLSLQESYDNSGLQVGDPNMEVSGIIISLDITEEVLTEALRHGYNLIVAHHPLIFGGLKKITGQGSTERIIMSAIKEGVAIYAGHTNFDAIGKGVNHYLAEKVGLSEIGILSPVGNILRKVVVFVPEDHVDKVRTAMFEAGAGHIGAYDSCSFNTKGIGTFKGSEESNPFAGEKEKFHKEPETRIETIIPASGVKKVISAIKGAHPYDEVAYDIYPLLNEHEYVGMGMVGELKEAIGEEQFLAHLKNIFDAKGIRHSKLSGKTVKRVAVCGGSGSFLIKEAIASGADVFVTGDFKYHQFFEAENRIVIIDIGHYESEQFTLDLFYELLTKKFPKFAVRKSEVNTNPIKYF